MNNNKIKLSELAPNNGSNNSLKIEIGKVLGLGDYNQSFMNNTDIINRDAEYVYYHTYQAKPKLDVKVEGRIEIINCNTEYFMNNEQCTKRVFQLFMRMAKLKCKFRFAHKFPACTIHSFIFLAV